MKRICLVLMLVLAAVSYGNGAIYGDDSAVVRAVENSNSIVIGDNENPETAYDRLIARTDMGTLSATNRRTLILLPGTYTLTGVWELDTDYVDVSGLGASPVDVFITRGTGGATATQTAADVKLSNLTIQNTGSASGDHGFLVNVASNASSIYDHCNFRQTHVTVYTCYPVFSTLLLSGTWRFCNADNCAWRTANGYSLAATMYDCVAGDFSFGGDNENTEAGTGVISGTLYRCVSGDYSFGGCTSFGMSATGYFEDCTAGDNSFAIGKIASGTFVRCKGKRNCFGGWNGDGTYYGTASGVFIDCESTEGYSFGMGHASSVQSGIFKRCIFGTKGTCAKGYSLAKTSTLTDSSASSALSTAYTGDENDLTFTAKKAGTLGNNIILIYQHYSSPVVTVATSDYNYIYVKLKSGTNTAAQIKTAIEGDSFTNSIVSVAFKSDGGANDGSGVIPAMTLDTYTLSGGIDAPLFSGNCSSVPIIVAGNTTVYYWDNGAIYSNAGIGGAAATVTLPAAVPGYSYTFVDADNTAVGDLNIDCVGTDNFVKPNGTAMADAEQYQSENDTFGKITATCYVAGIWQLENEVGTWVEESPP